jgi:hypothetical protein
VEDYKENVIEFLHNQKVATVTFSQGRYISRIKELAEKRPDECKITHTNTDGTIVAHIPTEWIRINPKMELSDEEKQRRTEILMQSMAQK